MAILQTCHIEDDVEFRNYMAVGKSKQLRYPRGLFRQGNLQNLLQNTQGEGKQDSYTRSYLGHGEDLVHLW